jgi:hypothetical protein
MFEIHVTIRVNDSRPERAYLAAECGLTTIRAYCNAAGHADQVGASPDFVARGSSRFALVTSVSIFLLALILLDPMRSFPSETGDFLTLF